jgi:hypothetical protein
MAVVASAQHSAAAAIVLIRSMGAPVPGISMLTRFQDLLVASQSGYGLPELRCHLTGYRA